MQQLCIQLDSLMPENIFPLNKVGNRCSISFKVEGQKNQGRTQAIGRTVKHQLHIVHGIIVLYQQQQTIKYGRHNHANMGRGSDI